MKVWQFIDHMVPGENDKLKAEAKAVGVPLKGEVLKLHLKKVYALADVLKVNGPDLVAHILEFENLR